MKRSYVEHVAIRVKDIHWHIRFFRDVLGMTIREIDGDAEAPKQIWTIGGMQLMSDPRFEGPEGRLAGMISVECVERGQEALMRHSLAFLKRYWH